jgi:hypothetical protein
MKKNLFPLSRQATVLALFKKYRMVATIFARIALFPTLEEGAEVTTSLKRSTLLSRQ